MKVYNNVFEQIISIGNLFLAWEEFRLGKGKKRDVQQFEFNLEQNIFQLHYDLKTKNYTHGPYSSFYILDPKVRHIHKATVRDRVLHHAIFRILNPIFEPTFIPTSYSCRIGKGTHKGVLALARMTRKESKNYSRGCFALKCDIRKFFDSIDHKILFGLCKKRIKDVAALWLIDEVIRSYCTVAERERVKGWIVDYPSAI